MSDGQDMTSLPVDMTTGKNTLYSRVADQLRQRILSGELTPGDQLESEIELAKELSVSRATVRGALEVLQNEGRISKQQGARSIVLPVVVTQALADLKTLDDVIMAQGLSSTMQIVRYLFERPTPAVAEELGISENSEVLSVRRLHLVEDEPIATVDLAIDAVLAADLSRRDIEEHAFYDLFPARLGIRVGRAEQRVRADVAGPEDAELLGAAEGAPILVCERITYSDRSQPLVHAVFRYRGDRFEFHSSLSSFERNVSWALPGLAHKAGSATQEKGESA